MGNLLFSPSGRVNPADFMRGVIILIVISAVLTLLPLISPALGMLGILGIIMIWCWIVLYVKRFHDAGKSGWLTVGVIVVMIVLSMIMSSVITTMFAGDMQAEIQKAATEAAESGDFGSILKGSMEAGSAMAKKVAIPSAIGSAVLSYVVAMAVNKFFPHDEGENQYGPAT
ncbi:MAG: DUF805 domain-containing protein [Robiginitomaculum sp.]|nr:DUF805 domain-containing protein [Robiginitomaculum sp.]